MKSNGLPLLYIKTLAEVYSTPKWSWYEDVIIETHQGDTYGCHGKSSGYNKLAREIGCSAFQGHFHSKFEVTWCNSVFAERYNMFVGCGIDRDSLCFNYGANNIPQPILGCGVIDDEGNPILVKMRLNKKGRWNGKI